MSTTAAVAAALGSAALFGLASALQHHQVATAEKTLSPRLLVSLMKRPLWLLGGASDVAAVCVQAVALGLGSVSLVQTLLVAGLPLAVLLSALLAHRGLRRRELLGLALCSAGLALLGPALTSTPSDHVPSRSAAALAGSFVLMLILPLLVLRENPRWGGLCAGTAAGAVIGTGSVLLAVAAGRFGDGNQLFSSYAPYLALAVGALGLLLAQVAFQTGDLGAPLAALSVTEPVVAVLLAATVLHEKLPTGGGALAAAVGGAGLAVVGVLVLTRD